MKSMVSRAVLHGLIILLGLLSAAPNLPLGGFADSLPRWYADNRVALGLDLRGGSHLLLAVDTEALAASDNQQFADQFAAALRADGIAHHTPVVSIEAIRIIPADPARLTDMAAVVRPLARAGAERLFSVEQRDGALLIRPTRAHAEALVDDAVERSLEVVRRRLNESGLVDPSITRQGEDGVLVQLPGVDDPAQIRQLLGTTARMTFHWAADGRSPREATLSLPDEGGTGQLRLERRVALEGKHIRDAQLAYHQATGQPVVTFRLDGEGARLFGDMTRQNLGRQLAVVLDDRVITAPVIRGVIAGGSGEISGRFSAAEANDLALLLRAGALPAPLDVVEERTVGPDLGSDAIAMGISTGLVGAGLVLLFMVGIYGRWGLIACVGLAISVGLIFGVLSVLRATLTLPGIAGIILSIGMAVDANILINERIREETRRGRSALGALDAGFRRAYGTILDSNVTSLIAISLLFLFGSGPVRGFAVAMAIGLVTSMFTAISFTRLIMEWRVRRQDREQLVISGIRALDRLSGRALNLMRGRFVGLAASAVLSLASMALFLSPGLKYGVDFSGGTVVEVVAPTTSVETLRQGLAGLGQVALAIQEFGDDGHFLVRLPMEDAEQVASGETVAALKSAVLTLTPDATFPRVEMVGPKVSGDFSDATVLAILLAGLGMLAYLWLRFEFHFALAATLTIALDLTKTIGFFVLAGVEFNLTAVAAMLALMGYSVNDKVVVFDRVRENLRLTPDRPMLELLNDSITSTLTRTVFTSVTTFLALVPMAVAGGAAVQSFAWPMLFGIVVGTSSSVLIAAPILHLLGQRRHRKGLAQLRPSAEEVRRSLELLP